MVEVGGLVAMFVEQELVVEPELVVELVLVLVVVLVLAAGVVAVCHPLLEEEVVLVGVCLFVFYLQIFR